MLNTRIEYTCVVARFDGPAGAGSTGAIVSHHGTRDEADAVAACLGVTHEVWPRPGLHRMAAALGISRFPALLPGMFLQAAD